MQLDRWDIRVRFDDDADYGFSAEALRHTPYREGLITIYPRILRKDGRDLDVLAIHELLHLVMWPLAEWEGEDNAEVRKHYDEEITDYLAQTIYHLSA